MHQGGTVDIEDLDYARMVQIWALASLEWPSLKRLSALASDYPHARSPAAPEQA